MPTDQPAIFPPYAHLSLALIDTIWSLSADSNTVHQVLLAHTSGIPLGISDTATWPMAALKQPDFHEYSVFSLLLHVENGDGEDLAHLEFGGDLSLTPGTAITKADTVKEATHLMVKHFVICRPDLVEHKGDRGLRAVWTSIPGLDDTSWDLLLDRTGIYR